MRFSQEAGHTVLPGSDSVAPDVHVSVCLSACLLCINRGFTRHRNISRSKTNVLNRQVYQSRITFRVIVRVNNLVENNCMPSVTVSARTTRTVMA